MITGSSLSNMGAGYILDVSEEAGLTTISYTLQTNETNQKRYGKIINYSTYVQVPMMIAMERQLCTVFLRLAFFHCLVKIQLANTHLFHTVRLVSGNDSLALNVAYKEQARPVVDNFNCMMNPLFMTSQPQLISHFFFALSGRKGRGCVLLWCNHVQFRYWCWTNSHGKGTAPESSTQFNGPHGNISFGH